MIADVSVGGRQHFGNCFAARSHGRCIYQLVTESQNLYETVTLLFTISDQNISNSRDKICRVSASHERVKQLRVKAW